MSESNDEIVQNSHSMRDRDMRQKRLCQVLKEDAEAGLALILYVIMYRITGIGVPCVFRKVTGLLCPGCGMTRALAALTRGRAAEALQLNALSLSVLPLVLCIMAGRQIRYIRNGTSEFRLYEVVLLCAAAGACIWYFLMRNHLL